MKTFTVDDPRLGLIQYTDKKRYLWLVSVLFPLIPLVGMGLMNGTGKEWTLWIPLVFLYAFIPLLDHLFPNDRSNPPEQLVPQLERDSYYRILNHLTVPLHFLILIIGAGFVASHDLGWSGLLALSLTVGAISGFAINTGHELGHKKDPADRLAAKLVLAVPFYGHFPSEHNAGHHAQVATPEDSASARFGESIYRFVLREAPGGILRAWQLEAQRLRRRGLKTWSWRNEILQSYTLSVLLYGGLLLAFGSVILPFLLIQTAFAWWQLTSANYIEHYGLLREKKPNGRYERCQPHHSWNANHLASNLITFHLERHSDHHAFAARRYQSLRHYDEVPQLPSGYFGMFLLAYVPPLWRRVMDPKVLALVDGDLNRVNRG
ncbi:MAG: alkane 1-monooxygenase [Xanthomonadales bacterium]|nr:alkane 1-monooxygenase [Gammaproteobacteria bacterium]MBT8052976.1 alkane 1-monooxygenase [Gammaproteobacteria bacterium]NND57868.1 alkane 1-monooxygenase [Xanthomonadales bacterium]NNK50748.1 alkane 1-monooxygenase [Xanthomonadales bacterium]